MNARDLVEVVAVSEFVLMSHMSEDAAIHEFVAHLHGLFTGGQIFEHPQQPVGHLIAAETFVMQASEPSAISHLNSEWRWLLHLLDELNNVKIAAMIHL